MGPDRLHRRERPNDAHGSDEPSSEARQIGVRIAGRSPERAASGSGNVTAGEVCRFDERDRSGQQESRRA